MAKVNVGQNLFLQFLKNPKLVAVLKRSSGSTSTSGENTNTSLRRIVVPIRILQFANEKKEELQDGITLAIDNFWEIAHSNYDESTYCCFVKNVNGKRSAVSILFNNEDFIKNCQVNLYSILDHASPFRILN